MLPEPVPPPERVSVPDCTLAVPELLKGTPTVVVPPPADFWNVAPPRLAKGPGDPRLVIDAFVWQSQVPWFVIAPDEPTRTLPVPVQAAVPETSRTREPVTSWIEVVAIVIPALAKSVPAPVIVPAFHVIAPFDVTLPVAVSVAPELIVNDPSSCEAEARVSATEIVSDEVDATKRLLIDDVPDDRATENPAGMHTSSATSGTRPRFQL